MSVSEKELLHLIRTMTLDSIDHTEKTEYVSVQSETAGAGEAWVSGNQIHVIDPINGELAAVVQPNVQIIVTVNGNVVAKEQAVRTGDKIEWSVVPQPLFRVDVSEDSMKATFRLLAKDRYAVRLKDTEKTNVLQLEIVEQKDMVLETVSLPQIMKVISDLGIVRNVNVFELYRELEQPTYEPIVISEGKWPTPGLDARFESYFNDNIQNVYEEIAGTVDFRNHLHIPSARKGDTIGRKYPAREGEPGYDVYSRVIPPSKPKDLLIVPKEHVQAQPDGTFIALREGRPKITGSSILYIDLFTSYLVPGDVDIKTGNIVFSGDVVVYGDVTENMIVESLGNVYVLGSVYGAAITATGSICIKGNIIKSQLYSGYYGVVYNRLYKHSEMLYKLLDAMTAAAATLVSILEAKRQQAKLGQILLMLIESKFKDVPLIVRDILSVILNIQHIEKDELVQLKERLEILLQPMSLFQWDSLDALKELQKMVKDTFEGIARMEETKVHVDIPQCYLSTVMSNGDVSIRSEGVLQSRVIASGNIVFYNETSVCKGSELEAKGSISAMNVGGHTCSGVKLKAEKKIVVKSMCAGRVCIGKYCRDILEPVADAVFDHQTIKASKFRRQVLK